jgi:predicted ATPase
MITKIYVDGFKTLSNFELNFLSGLNILVGPNGSGKTNIVSFFEFLSHLMKTDASEATSKSGGAGTIFSRNEHSYVNKIDAKIAGFCQPDGEDQFGWLRRKSSKEDFYQYYYEFTLLLTENRDAVLFERQTIKIKRINKEFIDYSGEKNDLVWDTHIEFRLDASGKAKTKIKKASKEIESMFIIGSDTKKRPERQANIEEFLNRWLTTNVSLVSNSLRYFPDLHLVGDDLSGGQSYNIIPSKVKLAEDSAKPPGIAKDGSGLAATFYALKKASDITVIKPFEIFQTKRELKISSDSLSSLKAYISLVNPAIIDFEIINDQDDNLLKLKFRISTGSSSVLIPLAQVSDGTLKWISLITAAITEPLVFSIEEPENYLHPALQGQIVTILRDILCNNGKFRSTLLTTHSETLLNSCQPEELVIVSFNQGKTVAKRCYNAVDVSEEINRTGFGLGYYYLNDSLRHE